MLYRHKYRVSGVDCNGDEVQYWIIARDIIDVITNSRISYNIDPKSIKDEGQISKDAHVVSGDIYFIY